MRTRAMLKNGRKKPEEEKGRKMKKARKEKKNRKNKHSPMKTRALEKKDKKETKSACRVCVEEDGDLIKCARCPAEIHMTKKCIGLRELKYVEPGKWICPRCALCHICNKFIDDASNRICFHCGHAFHGHCAPKTSSSVDEWLCDLCCPFIGEADASSVKLPLAKISRTPNRKPRKSVSATQRLPWCPGLQEQRDQIHNSIVDHYKRCHNISVSSDEMDPEKPSTSRHEDDFVVVTDTDWELHNAATNSHLDMVDDPPSPELPLHPSPESSESEQYINYFNGRSKCIYQSPYPDEIRNAPEIYVCAFCLRSYSDKPEYVNHANCCKWRHPPGNEIYRDVAERISVFEVDGIVEREYCRQLCLLAKVFLSSKTLYHEVDTFKFYILCEHTTKGFVIRGYFSKEKNPSKNNNLSCLLTLPVARRSGYGKLLIDLSYQLSLREKKIGSPEHPLSDLGLLTYRSYWKAVIFAHIRKMKNNKETVFSVKDLSHATGIHQSDLLQTLVESRIIHFRKESSNCFLNPNPAYYAPLSMIRRRTMLRRLLRLPRLASWRGCSSSMESSESPLSERYRQLVTESGAALSPEDARHSFLVIHPKIRWGENSAPKTTNSELQLAEAITLVRTLPGFTVANSVIVGTDYNTKKKRIWGAGRLDALVEVKNRHHVSAVMINVDILSPLQQSELHGVFGCPIYDRYNVVLLIFKHYARTKEAKLQIELAEIPYIRHRMRYFDNSDENQSVLNVKFGVVKSNSGADKYELLRQHEQSIRKKLKLAVESKTEEIERRTPRGTVVKPAVVSVIGYTNAGKTTMIKKLTGSTSLQGEDRLFATLDTSLHSAILPSRRHVMFADTIGFISQLPVQLFSSFSATLSHVVHSDVLIHIHDVSHPDVLAQRENVLETLQNLHIDESLVNNMISVGNKVDKLKDSSTIEKLKDLGVTHFSSCVSGEGIPELITTIDEVYMKITGSRPRRLKLKPESKAIPYLYREQLVSSEPYPSECGRFLVFDVFMSDEQMAKFQAHVGILKTKR
ncbi:hypothetical protein QR680_004922 [Steinernema hermaphroditum]|uniref:histone acetyltransferase n=1 Tax=Steinernema hermaphroditum TaxID=289476 RepID=A0AA39LUS9_9BILA|nr:hypothetical protein QR680_004922 [Steinernema hermaphroditum]